jgi:hypothetical protein
MHLCTMKPCLNFKKLSNLYIYVNEHTFWLQERNMSALKSGLYSLHKPS